MIVRILVVLISITSVYWTFSQVESPTILTNSISLPYTLSNNTLNVNTADITDPPGFVSSYTKGPDFFFYHKAIADGNIFVNLSFVRESGKDLLPSLSVWEGKPGSGGILIESVTSIGDDNADNLLKISFKAIINKDYWIMLDCGQDDGYNYSLFVYNSTIQNACSNIGFESGDFSSWILTDGGISEGVSIAKHPIYFPESCISNASLNSSTQHKIMYSGVDAIGGFKKVRPGLGTKSLLLGDSTKTLRRYNDDVVGVSSNGATIEQQFKVTSDNSLFTYYYAVVLEASNHAASQQPTFRIDAVDQDGKRILCGEYLVVASGTIPGFVEKDAIDNPTNPKADLSTKVLYKDWTPVFIDLTNYIGTSVTIRFTVMDCSDKAHFGYAYVDAVCQKLEITSKSAACNSTKTMLYAPPGGNSYKWTIKGNTTEIGTKDSLEVSPTAPTIYQCEIISVAGCTTTLEKTVTPQSKPEIASVSGDLIICVNEKEQLTATAVPEATNPWTSSDIAVATIDNTGLIVGKKAGTTIISFKSNQGCKRDTTITVNESEEVTGTTSLCKDGITQLKKNPLTPNGTNPWTSANTAIADVDNNGIVTGKSSGTTDIVYLSTNGCKTKVKINVYTTPNTTNPGTIEGCDSLLLPAILGTNKKNPNYYTNTHTSASRQLLTGYLKTNQTVWIFDSSGVCIDEKSFIVNLTATPTIKKQNDTNSCLAIALPPLTTGNYYTGTNKSGTKLIAGDSIKTSQKIYIYAESTTNASCYSENFFNININSSIAKTLKDSSVCDYFVLPNIPNVSYFKGANQTGGSLTVLDTIKTTQKIYAYIAIPGLTGCTSEKSFNITVKNSPIISPQTPLEGCDSIALPAFIPGSPMEYYSQTKKGGNLIPVGTYFNKDTTLFIYAETSGTPNCYSEKTKKITIYKTPKLLTYIDTSVCDSLVLIPLSLGNYFGAANQGGINYGTTDTIKSSIPIFIYAETGNNVKCKSEKSFNITVKNSPIILPQTPLVSCDSVALPAFTPGTPGEYYSQTKKGGNLIPADTYFKKDTSLYVYAETGGAPNCYSEKTKKITIYKTPILPRYIDTTVCDSLVLIPLSLGNYFGAANRGGINYGTTDIIKSSIPIFIYAETGNSVKCKIEKSFNITVKNSPIISPQTPLVGCDSVALPAFITGTPGEYYSQTKKGGNLIPTGTYFKKDTTLFVYAETGSTPNCFSEKTRVITVNKRSNLKSVKDTTVCDTFLLPTIIGTNLTGQENYFETPKSTLSTAIKGPITATKTIYIYDSLYTCSDEKSFKITVHNSPKINNPGDQSICDTFKLIKLTGNNLSGNENYYSNTQKKNGLIINKAITKDTLLFLYDKKDGCAFEDSFKIVIGQKPKINFQADKLTGCVPFTATFINASTNIGDSSIWYFGSDSLIVLGDQPVVKYSFKEVKCYDVQLKTAKNGCGNSATKQNMICGKSTPIADFEIEPTTISALNPNVTFFNTSSSDATSYLWDFGDDINSKEKNPKHGYFGKPQSYVVTLFASNASKCTSQKSKLIDVIDEFIYYVPNSFTPDGDNLNNTFLPILYSGFDSQSYTLTIFNRWGEILFVSHDPAIGWDGTYGNNVSLVGIYTWTIQVTTSLTKEVKKLHGHVNLIR